MSGALLHIDAFLQGAGPFHPHSPARRPWWWLPLIILGISPIFGGFMGSYHFVSAERLWQVAYSGVKLPILILTTTLICLPGFAVLNTVLGLRDDLRDSMQAILAGQAGLSLTLAALGPLTRFWYFSMSSYRGALLFNAGVFAVATLAGHLVMFRYYRSLMQRHRYHWIAFYAWLAMYTFVGIQMGWTLRPFVGSPDMPTTFLRAEPFSNAYVVVARLIFGG